LQQKCLKKTKPFKQIIPIFFKSYIPYITKYICVQYHNKYVKWSKRLILVLFMLGVVAHPVADAESILRSVDRNDKTGC
jgi:hypothetical protein